MAAPGLPGRRPIRLTYLITDLKVGGVPLHVYRLASNLPRDRVQVRVISLGEEGPVGAMLRRAGVPVTSCGARSARDVTALWRLGRLLRADRPDILHALLFHANMAARIIGPLAGLRFRQILCEIQTVEQERLWHLLLDNVTCRLCRCEIGNSRSVLAHLHRRAHIPRTRLRCEPGAVDVETFASAEPMARERISVPADEPMLIWTGRLDPVKGFEEMLEAFARVCRTQPARLVLAGEGPYRSAIEQLIRQHDLAGRVLLLGQRDDVPALLKAADLFLFCSRTEGMPNAVLEAMAAGLPVVATDVPGCRDVLRHGETGLLVPPGSAQCIAQAVQNLLKDEFKRSLLARNARAWVRQYHSLQTLIERWASFYEAIPNLGTSSSLEPSEA